MASHATKSLSYDEEFEELKRNYESFLVHVPQLKCREIRSNVFYHLVDDKRTKKEMVEMVIGHYYSNTLIKIYLHNF